MSHESRFDALDKACWLFSAILLIICIIVLWWWWNVCNNVEREVGLAKNSSSLEASVDHLGKALDLMKKKGEAGSEAYYNRLHILDEAKRFIEKEQKDREVLLKELKDNL